MELTKEYILDFVQNDELVKEIRNDKKFKITKDPWNNGQFMYPKKIGSVMEICRLYKPLSVKDLVISYLKTGEEHEYECKRIIKYNKTKKNKEKIKIDNEFNINHGRSLKELTIHMRDFRKSLREEYNIHLNFEEVCNFVLTRIFSESYEGYVREKETNKKLTKDLSKYGNYKVVKRSLDILNIAPSVLDKDYAADSFIVDDNGKMYCAIQIKSEKWKSKVVGKTFELNKKKTERFTKEFKIPVFYVFSDKNGNYEEEDLKKIIKYLKKPNVRTYDTLLVKKGKK